MSKKLQPVRGTHDLLPDEQQRFSTIVEAARNAAFSQGFKEMNTPIFEHTEVFQRTLGEDSDIVHKEMYTFQSKGEESLTLRPEFTAGIARAFITNGMQQNLPLKLFSYGPLFRYERPQKGRYRQFHQINCEVLGDDSVYADAEIILLAAQILFYITGPDSETTLQLNTLGDIECRQKYQQALVEYFTPYTNELSEDSKRRLKENPLRILDSKDEGDKKISNGAPQITQGFLSGDAQKRFETLCAILSDRKTLPKFEINPNIVRGLDYYTGVVFEFLSSSTELGAQNTVLAGGRYDNLIGQMGGNPTPAIGFAAGVERLSLILNRPLWENGPVLILPMGEVASQHAVSLKAFLSAKINEYYYERLGKRDTTYPDADIFPVDILYTGNIGKRMKKANDRNASHVIIIGEEEIANKHIKIKNMQSSEEKTVGFGELYDLLYKEKLERVRT